MKGTIAFLAAVAVLLPNAAQCRPGETLVECIERYGEVVTITEGNSQKGYVFEKSDLRITCFFHDDADWCSMISYFKINGPPLQLQEKARILDILKGEGKWEEFKDPAESSSQSEQIWRLSSTGDLAFMERGALIIVSKRTLNKRQGFDGL